MPPAVGLESGASFSPRDALRELQQLLWRRDLCDRTRRDDHQQHNHPELGPLADNGGPAINAGDPSIDFDANEFDQRGAPFFRVGDGQIDIGAFEVQAAPLATSESESERAVRSPATAPALNAQLVDLALAASLPIADFGLRIADFGIRVVSCPWSVVRCN